MRSCSRDAHSCNCRAAVRRRLQGQLRSKLDDLVEGDRQAPRIICDFMLSCCKSVSPVVHPLKPKSTRAPRRGTAPVAMSRQLGSCQDCAPPRLPGFVHVAIDDAGTHLQCALHRPAYSWRWSSYDLHHLMMLGCAFVDECGSWDRERFVRLEPCWRRPGSGHWRCCRLCWWGSAGWGRRPLRAARRPAMTRDVSGRD